MIPISHVSFGTDVEESVLAVLRSGMISQGPKVVELETAFAALAGAQHAVAVNNGTTALVATLQALGIGPGAEVVVPAFTFVATVNAVLEVGATARLVDICDDDFGLDIVQARAVVGERTAAVMPVHLYGQPVDLDGFERLTDEHGLHLIEDAAQAHGAAAQGRPVGSVGIGCFSFYATKNLVAGEGGMITTNDDALAARLRILRNQGMATRYRYEVVGHNYRMTDLAAAVVLPQLARYDQQVKRRCAHAAQLGERLRGVDGIVLPATRPGRHHVWHQYTVRLTGETTRDVLAAGLAERGIGSGVYYPQAIQRYSCYADHPRVVAEPTPVADAVAASCLSLPVHADLTDEQVDRVADAVIDVLRKG